MSIYKLEEDLINRTITKVAKDNNLDRDLLDFYFRFQFEFVSNRMHELDTRPIRLKEFGVFMMKKKFKTIMNNPKQRVQFLIDLTDGKNLRL